ncbi:MAG: Holliday junction branch migration protein RuvA [Clostridia bacterium]
MIAFLAGTVDLILEDSAILDVQGVGYQVFMTEQELLSLTFGDKIKVYTHHHQREDIVALFGFLSRETLNLFQILIGVNGIGPKMAQGIFARTSSQELTSAIQREDVVSLMKLPGIGKKTAQRLVLELKDKLIEFGLVDASPKIREDELISYYDYFQDAKAALIGLGYQTQEIEKALKAIVVNSKTEQTTESLIRGFLQNAGKNR